MSSATWEMLTQEVQIFGMHTTSEGTAAGRILGNVKQIIVWAPMVD